MAFASDIGGASAVSKKEIVQIHGLTNDKTYGMESMFGPLEATFNYTNHSDKLGFYINLGYKF